MVDTPRVLFVLKYREQYYDYNDYGSGFLHSGLYNSASFVDRFLNSVRVPSRLVHVADNNVIHKEIVEFNANVVIIEAFWVVPEKFDELQKVCPNVKFIIRNHSKAPFLANEGIAFDWTLRYLERNNVYVSANSVEMTNETRALADAKFNDWSKEKLEEKTPYLPNTYPLTDVTNVPFRDDKIFDIGCFGAIRPLKNQMNQAIAAIKLADYYNYGLRFHINAGRIENNGTQVLKNIRGVFQNLPNDRYQLIEHGWVPHDEFKVLIRQMDVVSQVSYSETFNIVGADAVSCGVPFITSSEVPWAFKPFVADPNSTEDIFKKLRLAIVAKKMTNANFHLGKLRNYSKQSESMWIKFLFGK
jgi:hypothetical protein